MDKGDETWKGNVGVITTLIPKVQIDPKKTMAVVVGPPIMYRFVIGELKKRDMPDENIIMSLERRMKCGVGKCGHCQINGVYVCQEGPGLHAGATEKSEGGSVMKPRVAFFDFTSCEGCQLDVLNLDAGSSWTCWRRWTSSTSARP